MAVSLGLLPATCPAAQAHALGLFGDLNCLQVVESREIGAGFEAMLRMPELLSNRNQSTIRSVAVSSDGAEMLAIEHLLRIYRIQKALVPFERQSSPLNAPRVAEFRLLHLFVIYVRMHLGHNPQAILDIDSVLSADISVSDLDAEELCEALNEAINRNRELRQSLWEEVEAIWNTVYVTDNADQ